MAELQPPAVAERWCYMKVRGRLCLSLEGRACLLVEFGAISGLSGLMILLLFFKEINVLSLFLGFDRTCSFRLPETFLRSAGGEWLQGQTAPHREAGSDVWKESPVPQPDL